MKPPAHRIIHISDPCRFLMIAPPAPGTTWPVVGSWCTSAFVEMGGGWKAHYSRLRRGDVRFVTEAAYHPTADRLASLGYDCLGRRILLVSPALVAGLVLTTGSDNVELDLRKLFTRAEDARAATADLGAVFAAAASPC